MDMAIVRMNRNLNFARLHTFAVAPPTWLVLVAGAAILALRRPDQIANPQLWAEDGIFFFQARELGWRAFTLELAGYFQLAPRATAALASLVDPAWVPHVFVGCTVAGTLYVMSRALSPRSTLPLRAASALAIVLVPDASEVMLNSGNIQWVLAMGYVLLLLSTDPARRTQWLHDIGAAIMFGLSGPFSVLMTPFFAWRAAMRRTRPSAILALVVAACALVQVASILAHPQPVPANPTLDATAMAAFPGLRVAGGVLPGSWLLSMGPGKVAIVFSLMVLGVVAVLGLSDGEHRWERRVLAAVFCAFLASTYYRCWHSMPVLCLPANADRYVFPLQLTLLWLLLASVRHRSRLWRVTAIGAAAWMVIFNVPRLRIAALPDRRWGDYAPKLRAGEEVTIPINPAGWTFTFPERKR